MVLVSKHEEKNVVYYIPHSCVIKPDSSTTKLRVVFDASAKTSTGKSLNDLQAVGPVIQRDQFDLAIEFRGADVVLSADVTKMYRQVMIEETQTWAQCILYRFSENDEIRTYRLLTVTYGEASSSYLACRALHEVGEEIKDKHPKIAEVIRKCFYVDNLMVGAATVEELKEIKESVTNALAKRGFPLRKWASNKEELLEGIPSDDLEQTVQIGDRETIKTLGINWAPRNDTFSFKPEENQTFSTVSLTKRQLASEILRLYDPLGLIQPIIITAKILFQQLWRYKLNWDDLIPEEMASTWFKLKADLPALTTVEFPRQVLPSKPHQLELHGFCDASTKAFGACIYLTRKAI
ncbi:uncharacterized protein LOC129774521 [Toxorhynchites rutilus septentrionalis]|uniref:uncharacterized protein LOC129774521 n=1 Tax=Toxorhynchites rutilus septentrionalis TaxID=329112 RepID=UPI002478726D|nr:uncharacterized protein LOC129774521 [Toxorhynchites rutilus septentrionalis]